MAVRSWPDDHDDLPERRHDIDVWVHERNHDDMGDVATRAVHRHEDVVPSGGVLAAAGAWRGEAVAPEDDGLEAGFEDAEVDVVSLRGSLAEAVGRADAEQGDRADVRSYDRDRERRMGTSSNVSALETRQAMGRHSGGTFLGLHT